MSNGAFLVVLGEREIVAWVLTEQRLGFPSTHRPEVDKVAVGDELFLLTTRGCFHNPSRDRTRVIGRGTVTTDVEPLEPTLKIAGRAFARHCGVEIATLVPYLEGVEVHPLVESLDMFPADAVWSTRLLRPLVPLGAHDARVFRERLDPVAEPFPRRRDEYVEQGRRG